jgi:DNA-3-methyladenine glycosylase I
MSQLKIRTISEKWYSDTIWGKPIVADDTLFEIMSLQVFQAGLGWKLILNKREGFRNAFHNWSIPAVARFGPNEEERLLSDSAIIRNRLKIRATVYNARQVLEIQQLHGSFTHWFYDLLEGNSYPALQRELGALFKFMGPELCRMWLMAAGRITMSEGDSYRPSGTPSYAEQLLWPDSPDSHIRAAIPNK